VFRVGRGQPEGDGRGGHGQLLPIGRKEYEQALAEALREEDRAIVDAGFVLQVDDPRLVTYYIYYMMNPGVSVADCRA
jgi:hypothetical protein